MVNRLRMVDRDPADLFARLADSSARIREAASPDDVLDIVAEHARILAGAPHAWAGHVENDTVGALRSRAADEGADGGVKPPSAADAQALLDAARPCTVARKDGHVAIALLGAGATPEGVVIVSGAPDDGGLDLALAHLGSLAGLALESARLRVRVDSVTRGREALFATIAHDLRNPLNTFAMSAGLLRDDAERNEIDATRAVGLVTRMERATSRMQVLIDDLVEASRVDARKIAFAIRDERAAQIVRDAVAAAVKAAPEKSAAVVCDSVDDDAVVRADRARTLQALSKTLAFASKSHGDSATISVGVARQDGAVVFTVRATAPGAVRPPPPDDGRGGLALLLARGLIEGQSGTFTSKGDDGLLVSFTLPTATT